MIKYTETDIVFQEVPDEVSLAINISNCPHRCEGCHSPHLREDIGRDLETDLPDLLNRYGSKITCVLFLGEGNDPDALSRCVQLCFDRGIKQAVYSGVDLPEGYTKLDVLWQAVLCGLPDYIKLGSYKKELGGLSSPSTNQRMFHYSAIDSCYEDITDKFWHRTNEKPEVK